MMMALSPDKTMSMTTMLKNAESSDSETRSDTNRALGGGKPPHIGVPVAGDKRNRCGLGGTAARELR